MLASIQKRNAEVARLALYFTAMPDGEDISWLRIEHETGVVMDMHGRGLARRGLHRARRPYEAICGVGVRMSATGTALQIMRSRFVRIDGAVRRAESTRGVLAVRHLDSMEPADRERMLILAGFFGAVRAFAREAGPKLIQVVSSSSP